VTYGGLDAMAGSNGYITTTDPITGGSFTVPDDRGGDDAAAANAAASAAGNESGNGTAGGPVQSRGCGDCTGTNNAFNDPNAFDLTSGPIIDTSRGPGNQLAQGSALVGNYLSVAAIADMASEVTVGLSNVASFVEATVSSAAEFAHSFGVAGLAFGTGADFISLKNNGISQTQLTSIWALEPPA